MKLNLQNPVTGGQTSVAIDDDRQLRVVYDRSLGDEVDGTELGFPGYVFKITGGTDRDGFPMKQGVHLKARVKLLIKPGTVGFRAHWARNGERVRKTIRGCIVAGDIASLSLVVVKSGDEKVEALEKEHPRLLFPKRASKVRRLLSLAREVNPVKEMPKTKHIIKKSKNPKVVGKPSFSRVRVQRLITPAVRRRRDAKAVVKSKRQARSVSLRRDYQHKVDRLAKLSVQRRSAKTAAAKAAKAKTA